MWLVTLIHAKRETMMDYFNDVEQLIENAFKSLFEEKHLYQSVSIDDKEINRIADAAGRGPGIAIKSAVEQLWVP